MHRFARFAVAAVAVLAMTTTCAPAQGLSSSRWGQVWGTWVHQTQSGPGLKIPALVTFHVDGALTGAPGVMFGGVPNATVTNSVLYGVWQRTGWKSVAATSLILTFDRATGVLTGFLRTHSRVEFADDFNSYTGTHSFEVLTCTSPLACPDPLDPGAAWAPMPGMPASVPVSGKRLELVKSDALKP